MGAAYHRRHSGAGCPEPALDSHGNPECDRRKGRIRYCQVDKRDFLRKTAVFRCIRSRLYESLCTGRGRANADFHIGAWRRICPE